MTVVEKTRPIILIVGSPPAGRGVDAIRIPAATADQILAFSYRWRPRVVVIDVAAFDRGGADIVRTLLDRSDVAVLVLVDGSDEGEALAALRAGASGVLDREARPERLAAAIDCVAGGDLVFGGLSGARIRERLQATATDERHALEDAAMHEIVDRATADAGPTMHVQPIVDLVTRTIVGYEALARFGASPGTPPSAVFDAAGRINRRLELELASVHAALVGLSAIPHDCYLAINASPETVTAAAFHQLMAGVEELDRLVLEVTENAPVEDYGLLNDALRPLRDRGLRLAIDDTGAGFASLRHILRLQPDIIKLDGSLTDRLDHDPQARALAGALSTVALEGGMTIIGEHVETPSQLAVLEALGVSCGQGYLLGRPVAVG